MLHSCILCLLLVTTSCNAYDTYTSKTSPPVIHRRGQKQVRLQNWLWSCQDGHCIRQMQPTEDKTAVEFTYLEGCKSVCGPYGSLWPQPTGSVLLSPGTLNAFQLDDVNVKFDLDKFAKDPNAEVLEDALTESWTIFTQYLALMPTAVEEVEGLKALVKRSVVLVKITVEDASMMLSLSTDESYSLTVVTRPRDDEVQVLISALTFFGARHALETLSQLITYDPHEQCYRICHKAKIEDKPAYPYRGILLDTGRNYFPIPSIERVIDGMSYNKLNVLHWHMNEQQSFPFVSDRVPELTSYGAYSQREVYYKDEIQSLVMYARQRGVLLLPEMDAPAHAAYGWQFGPDQNLGNLVTCLDKRWAEYNGTLAAEPPAGQLNPTNENVYRILGEVYKDMVEAFTPPGSTEPLKMFHMGGDEVNFMCWAKEPEIAAWIRAQKMEVDPELSSLGYLYLWSVFQDKALKLLNAANGGHKFKDGVIVWTSELTKPHHVSRYLDASKYVIQVWTSGSDPIIAELLQMRYRLIMSNSDAWYLDCGYGSWLYSGSGPDNNWCSPFKGWKTVYANSLQEMVRGQGLQWSTYSKHILGGEGTMWSEQVDDHAVEAKLWPRGCALAERLWTDPQTTGWKEAEHRILEQRRRMAMERGIGADAIQPDFCRQNDGYCYTLPRPAAMLGQVDINQNRDISDAESEKLERERDKRLKRMNSSWFDSTPINFIKWITCTLVLIMIFLKRRLIISTGLNIMRTVRFIHIH